ncbi:MAG: DUF4178 domain-containing protein [Nannocystis sp.]|nr:DUF4178 domain-containing protein [Nannocystis sp.]MBA3546686.1 DUF4178 domain-containing protein [Nannocystis sp.]
MTLEPTKKLFRDEAQAESIKCLGCGGPITLHSFGAVQRVICPHCGSALAPADSGALALLEAATRKHQDSVLPLHARGTLDGVEWEIIGICWRRCVVEGVAYPWQEFLLFNPYRGFRWLIHSNTDGHWTLGANLDGAPEILETRHQRVRFKKRRYKHFQGANAVVTYVEGEFTWEVHVGDRADANDFIDPPHGLSIEQSSGPDGAELNFTIQQHIDAKAVWKAFARPGKPPKTRGVGALQPNPWRRHRAQIWLSFLVFLFLHAFLSKRLEDSRKPHTVIEEKNLAFDESISRELTIGREGERTAIEFHFSPDPLDNTWAYAEVMLINIATEQAVAFGVEASYYHGMDDGEYWSEGHGRGAVTIGGFEGGKYLLQIQTQRDTTSLGGGPFFIGATRHPTSYGIELVEDVYLTRYSGLALLVIFGVPMFGGLMGWIFERRRWRNSDYAPGGG